MRLRNNLKQQQIRGVFAASSADGSGCSKLRLHKDRPDAVPTSGLPGTSGVDLVPQALEIEAPISPS